MQCSSGTPVWWRRTSSDDVRQSATLVKEFLLAFLFQKYRCISHCPPQLLNVLWWRKVRNFEYSNPTGKAVKLSRKIFQIKFRNRLTNWETSKRGTAVLGIFLKSHLLDFYTGSGSLGESHHFAFREKWEKYSVYNRDPYRYTQDTCQKRGLLNISRADTFRY